MQTDSKYNIHTQYASFLNPQSTKTLPNIELRTFILNWVKDGKDISPTVIAREYTAKTGDRVSYQRVQALIEKLGAKTLRKIRTGVLILMLMGSLAAAQVSFRPATELALQIPQVRQWVYPQKAYAVEPSISIPVPEGVVEIAQVASTSAGQTLPTPTPSVYSYKEAKITAYSCGGLKTEAEINMNCPSLKSGKPRTANGTTPIAYRTMACDRKYMGQTFVIDGLGEVTCTDTGSAIVGEGRFDIYLPTVEEARKFGVQKRTYRSSDLGK